MVDNHDARHFAGSFGKDDKDLVVVSANLGHFPHLGSTAPRPGEIAVVQIAERIRHDVDHFAGEHCDMRINQQFLDTAGKWRGARCVATGFNPVRWNPLITNVSGFGVYRTNFEDTSATYCMLVMKVPVAGYGSLIEGPDGRGLVFQMTLPPKDFEAMSSPAIREHLHRFRRADDDIPRLHREVHD